MTKAFGADVAREIMTHDPDTRTLERYYLDRMRTLNVAAVGYGEDPSIRQDEMDMESNDLALTTLSSEQLANTQGHVLNALCRQMAAEDSNYPPSDSRSCKNYNRRIAGQLLLRCSRNSTLLDVNKKPSKILSDGRVTSKARLTSRR